MDRLIRISVEHRGSVILLSLALALGGLWALRDLPLRVLPDLAGVRITLYTPAPTFSAREVAHRITSPLEEACRDLPGTLGLHARSQPELSLVTLVFEPGTRLREARSLAAGCAEVARSHLPPEVGVPSPSSEGSPDGLQTAAAGKAGAQAEPAGLDPALWPALGALAQSALLVLAVILLFIGHLRSGLLVALLLPWILLASLLVFRLAGLSLDVMSLSGLVLALGLVADAPVILVENAVRLLGRPAASGHARCELIQRAAREVKGPVLAGGGAILIALLPIAWLPGLEGAMLAAMAHSAAITLACALALSCTLTPALAHWLLKPAPIFGGSRIPHPGELVRRAYRPQLAWALRHPLSVLALTVLVLVLAMALAPGLGAGNGGPLRVSALADGDFHAVEAATDGHSWTAAWSPVSSLLSMPRYFALAAGIVAAVVLLLSLHLRQPRAVAISLVGLPPALAGGILGLELTGLPSSGPAQAGFLVLMGISLLPALVLVGVFRTLEAEGRGRGQAVRLGAELRLRPILTLAITTVVGLGPLVWIPAAGWELLQPLAVVVIAGVVVSTLLTVMLVPVLYRRLGPEPMDR